MQRKSNLYCMILFAVLLTGTLWQTAVADIEDTVEKSFSVKEGGVLAIDSDLGSIQVTSGSSDKVIVKVYRTADASSSKRAEELLKELKLDFVQTGDRVEVTARFERESHFWHQNRLRLRFEAQVPKKFSVDLRTAGGSISVDDLEGRVDSKTSGGSLTFGKIIGPVVGKTSGGSIRLGGCKGDANVTTSGGSIHIGDVEGSVDASTSGGSIGISKAAGTVMAHTSGGGIHVEEVMGAIEASTSGGSVTAVITKQPEGPCRLMTSGGSVEVTLAKDIKVDLDAHTSGGHVYTDFPVTVQGEVGRSNLQGPINGGGPQLYLRTSGGGITIHKSGAI